MTSKYDEVLLESALGAMHSLGLEPDPWQLDVLVGKHQRLLLNCCRQSGKSTTVALLSVLETGVVLPQSRVLRSPGRVAHEAHLPDPGARHCPACARPMRFVE